MRTEWNSLRKLESPGAHSREVSGGTPYTSLRLQVESTSVSSRMPFERSSSEARRARPAAPDNPARPPPGGTRKRGSFTPHHAPRASQELRSQTSEKHTR